MDIEPFGVDDETIGLGVYRCFLGEAHDGQRQGLHGRIPSGLHVDLRSDTIAHEIASDFYRALKERPGVPFSRIFAEIRRKAYDRKDGADTYAAYCFYGDPDAPTG